MKAARTDVLIGRTSALFVLSKFLGPSSKSGRVLASRLHQNRCVTTEVLPAIGLITTTRLPKSNKPRSAIGTSPGSFNAPAAPRVLEA